MARYFDRGDVVWIDHDPARGSEIKKKRLAMVLSTAPYTRCTGLIITVPITNTYHGWPTEVRLPDGMKTTGVVLAQQIKTLDYRDRDTEFKEKAEDVVVEQVMTIVRAFFR